MCILLSRECDRGRRSECGAWESSSALLMLPSASPSICLYPMSASAPPNFSLCVDFAAAAFMTPMTELRFPQHNLQNLLKSVSVYWMKMRIKTVEIRAFLAWDEVLEDVLLRVSLCRLEHLPSQPRSVWSSNIFQVLGYPKVMTFTLTNVALLRD